MEIPFPFIDPVAIDLPGKLDIRWYGIAYVAGFFIGYRILTRLAREGRFPFGDAAIGNLLASLALGLIIGGRLGYAVAYAPRLLSHPADLVAIWDGGLSFHGGLVGVVIAGIAYVRASGIGRAGPSGGCRVVADAIALAATPGIFLVRLANFIRGELFGRFAGPDALFAVRFPSDPKALELLGVDRLAGREQELAIQKACADGTWDRIKAGVPLRHPSQLYEAALEGLVLGIGLWAFVRIARARGWRIGNGFVLGLFLAGYGVCRFCVEWVREPDPQLGFVVASFTMGQLLCSGMIAAGALFMILALANPGGRDRQGTILAPGAEVAKRETPAVQ